MLHDQFRAERLFSRWRVRPCYGEPGNSYFPRLTIDSENCLPETFAKRTGLWIGEKRSLNLLKEMTKLPLDEGEKASLDRWTPVQSDTRRYWSLCGEEIPMSQLSPGRRACTACIREAAYHRVWWDLKGFAVCPVHDCALTVNPDRHDRRWPYYGLCLERIQTPPVLSIRGRKSFEGYVLQRLGAVERIAVRVLLDDQPLSAVIQTCDITGLLLLNPPSNKKPLAPAGDVAAGFDALSGTAGRLAQNMARWLRDHYSKKELVRVSMGHYGFLRHTNHSRLELSQRLRAAQVVACEAVGPINPKLRLHPAAKPSLLLDGLDKALSVTIHSSRILLDHVGHQLRKGPRGLYEIPDEVVRRLRVEIDRSVPLPEVSARLGCSLEDADLLAVKLAKKGWRGCIQMRRGDAIERRFLAGPLVKLEEALNSLPEAPWHIATISVDRRVRKALLSKTRLMADALLGSIEAWRDPENPALAAIRFRRPNGGKPAKVGRKELPADAMLWSEFHAILGIDTVGIKRLVELGHLTAHPDDTRYLLKESAMAFKESYVSPMRYFRAQGMGLSEAVRAAMALGLEVSFETKDVGLNLVERKLFEARIGKPTREMEAVWSDLWQDFARLGTENCPSFIIPQVPGDGLFSISLTTRMIKLGVVLAKEGIVLRALFTPQYRRSWNIYQRRRAELQKALESFRWDAGGDDVIAETVLSSVTDVERVTKEIGQLTEFFRYKMP